MNRDRRNQIAGALKLIEQAKEILETAKSELETARDDERDYYDNMPESLQGGEKGERASASADALDEAIDAFGQIDYEIDNIETACGTATE